MSVADLRKNQTMANLLDGLEAGKDIGHYGRLVFTIVARHFLSEAEAIAYLQKDPDFSESEAKALYQQVAAKNYNPPRREKILEWQQHQKFTICPNAEDPDAGNIYQDLQFPSEIYEQISEYHQQKA